MLSKEQLEIIKSMMLNGNSDSDISCLLKVSSQAIRYHRKKLHIQDIVSAGKKEKEEREGITNSLKRNNVRWKFT